MGYAWDLHSSIWVLNQKSGFLPPKSSILIVFSIIFTIHFQGFTPIFGLTPIYFCAYVIFSTNPGTWQDPAPWNPTLTFGIQLRIDS